MAKRYTKKQTSRKAWAYTGRNAAVRPKPFGAYMLIRLEITEVKRELLQNWRRAESEFEKQQRQWDAYCNEDRPAYEKWKHMTFGSRMTELRELHEALHRKTWFIDQMELVCDLYGRKPSALYRELYKKAVDGKTMHEALNDYIAELRKADEEDDDDDDEFDDEDIFDDDDNHEMDDEEEFLKNIFSRFFKGDDEEENDSDYRKIFDDEDENPWGAKKKIFRENPEVKNIKTRIKDIYRKLCFKLHPDTGCDFNAENSRLWHQIQKAYQENDLDSLLAIQAAQDMKQDPMASHITCAQILAVINEFKEGMRSVRGLISNAKRESSWAFLTWSDKQRKAAMSKLEQQMSREMQSLKYEMEHLDRIENDWARTVKPKTKPKPQPKAKTKATAKAKPQPEVKTKPQAEKPQTPPPPEEEQFTSQMSFDF